MLADHKERGVDLGDFTREVATSTGVPVGELTNRGTSERDSLMRRVESDVSVEVSPEFTDLRRVILLDTARQINGLRDAGVVRERQPGFEGYTALMLAGDAMAMTYRTPRLQDISRVLDRHHGVIVEKASQGFDRLLAVPTLAPVSVMVDAFMGRLQRASELGVLEDLDGKKLELVKSDDNWRSLGSVFTGYERNQKNYPKTSLEDGIDPYEQREQLHFPGWEFFLVQDLQTVPISADGLGENGHRTPLAAGWSAEECIDQLAVGGVYEHEVGYTPHLYFAHVMRELQRPHVVLDTKTEILLFGSVISRPDNVVLVMRFGMVESEPGSNTIEPVLDTSEPTREVPTAYGRTAVRLP